MTTNERYLYLQAAQLEFEALCKKIVHDGRDPYVVACAMTEQLAHRMREMRFVGTTRA